MANPRLVLLSPDNREREFGLSGSASIGRAGDNTVCLAEESVSRYHAIIEERAGGFWLSDLGSVYGTTVNQTPVKSDYRLRDGDVISVGGAVSLRYVENSGGVAAPEPALEPVVESAPANYSPAAPEPPPASSTKAANVSRATGLSPVMIAVATTGVLLFVLIAALIYRLWPKEGEGGGCGNVKIANPSSDETISGPVTMSVTAERPECIKSVSYRIDGRQFANSSLSAFEATLDPIALKQEFPDLADGEHELSISARPTAGQSALITDSVRVKIKFPDSGGEVSLKEIREMVEKLAIRINQRGEIFDDDSLRQIRDATRMYQTDMSADAERLRPEIRRAANVAGIPAQLMFVLAGSRSRFKEDQAVAGCGAAPNGLGVLKVPPALMIQFGEDTISDQRKTAEVAAKHLKEMMGGQGENFIYAVACFGQSRARIGEIEQRNDQQARRNFWALAGKGEITAEEARRAVCFFASGIVAENPEKFGLTTAKSFVEIY